MMQNRVGHAWRERPHLVSFMMNFTRCGILVDYLSRIKYSPESIQRTVIRMVLRTKRRNPDNPRNVSYFNWNGDRWYQNWNWLDNQWNSHNLVVRRCASFHLTEPLLF